MKLHIVSVSYSRKKVKIKLKQQYERFRVSNVQQDIISHALFVDKHDMKNCTCIHISTRITD